MGCVQKYLYTSERAHFINIKVIKYKKSPLEQNTRMFLQKCETNKITCLRTFKLQFDNGFDAMFVNDFVRPNGLFFL